MTDGIHPISKLDFLLGKWNMEYKVPAGAFSKGDHGSGIGEFKKILSDNYISFDYNAELSSGKAAAHGIFAWDEKAGIYKYWWFESTGSFLTADCSLTDSDTLFMKWNDTPLIQTFKKENPDRIILQMKYQSGEDKNDLIMEIIFTRQ